MKRKLFTLLLIICSVTCLSLVLTGCSNCSPSQAAHYDYLVTFNYNTDGLDTKGEKYDDQYLGVFEGGKIMQPVKPSNSLYGSSDFKERQINRYEVMGWYTAKLDENGNVVKGEDGRPILDRRWNFASDIVTCDMTLYAYLEVKPSVSLVYDGKVQKTSNYTKGSKVTQQRFLPVPPTWAGHTFYGYYKDEKLTEKFTFPFTVEEEDVTIYARFIDGENWSIVNTAQEFVKAYHTSAKIYVDADLDFDGVDFDKTKLAFNGEINGNGHKISGIDVTIATEINNSGMMGFFGRLGATSYIRDLTFENMTVRISTVSKLPTQAALFAWRIDDGAKLEKVKVTNGRILRGSIYEGSEAVLYGLCTQTNLDGVTITDCDFGSIDIEQEP